MEDRGAPGSVVIHRFRNSLGVTCRFPVLGSAASDASEWTPYTDLLAAQEAGEHVRGATAYLNLEPAPPAPIRGLQLQPREACLMPESPPLLERRRPSALR
ncbi:unnamed protein product [Urochloa humidicola]